MKINLNEWKNARLISNLKTIEGRVAYGHRKPIAPSTDQLIEECPGKKARYWFVNENQAIKIRLYFPFNLNDKIYSLGRDTTFFGVKIIKCQQTSEQEN